jgi:TolA-binding protein
MAMTFTGALRKSCAMAIAVVLLGTTGAAWADSVVVKSGGTSLPFDDVKINSIADGAITFTSGEGRQTSRDLSQVISVKCDDEPALNSAEDAFAAGNFSEAADDYQNVINSTSKDWVKSWATLRLVTAAAKANRFDAAATAYVQLVLANPASAEQFKPKVPTDTSYLATAEKTINDAIDTTSADQTKSAQTEALLSFLLEIEQAKHDNAAAAAVADRLLKYQASSGDPNAGKVLIQGRLAVAQSDIDQGKLDDALDLIHTSAASITDPTQQADALYLIAEAKDAQAQAKNDDNFRREAALAYMRVVASFKDQTDNPHIADALLKTAAIEEQLHNADETLGLYQQVAAQYPQSPEATVATQAIARLSAAGKPQ